MQEADIEEEYVTDDSEQEKGQLEMENLDQVQHILIPKMNDLNEQNGQKPPEDPKKYNTFFHELMSTYDVNTDPLISKISIQEKDMPHEVYLKSKDYFDEFFKYRET